MGTKGQAVNNRSLSGVQILAGILAILSAVMLVIFFAKLDDLITRQYFNIFQVKQMCVKLYFSDSFNSIVTNHSTLQ